MLDTVAARAVVLDLGPGHVCAVEMLPRLEAAGTPAVAVFWVSTEDHDFREVARATFFGRQGPETLELGEDPEPLAPLGMSIARRQSWL